MSHCFNPACSKPQNPDNAGYCTNCGTSLTVPYLFGERYRIVQVLGQGAFGRTYKAKDLRRFDHPCVIKKFIAQGQGESLRKAKELFQREAQRLNELNHPQIPRLYDYVEQEDSLYLVQDFVEGEDLLAEFYKRGRYSEAEIREVLLSLLPVLQYLHNQDPPLIHRDIKPENIMRRRKDNRLVLIDFGGAKQIVGTSPSSPGTIIYTPGYAPFEQINGKSRPTSDLYSLGATCARLFTGYFPRQTSNGMCDALYDAENGRWLWKEYSQHQGIAVSSELSDVLDGLLKHFARSRYQSAKEVLAVLKIQAQHNYQPPIKAKKKQAVLSILRSPQNNNSTILSSTIVFSTPQIRESLKTFRFEVVTVDCRGRTIDCKQKQAQYFSVNLGSWFNRIPIEMVAIPDGTFMMGSLDTEEGRDKSEEPQHRVTVPPFYMSKYAITQEQWQAVAKLPKVKLDLNPDPSYFKGAKCPVERVSWYDAVEFCARLSKRTGREYRLPSEAEWEYACRAGTITPFHFGETITTDLANYEGNYTYASAPKGQYREETVEVGHFPANAFGLYEMHGNVWEWCADSWHENYKGASTDGSTWGNDNASHLLRGGSWGSGSGYCRSAYRDGRFPVRLSGIGFRVVGVVARTQ